MVSHSLKWFVGTKQLQGTATTRKKWLKGSGAQGRVPRVPQLCWHRLLQGKCWLSRVATSEGLKLSPHLPEALTAWLLSHQRQSKNS